MSSNENPTVFPVFLYQTTYLFIFRIREDIALPFQRGLRVAESLRPWGSKTRSLNIQSGGQKLVGIVRSEVDLP
jgi:hypothetical protein